LQADKHQLAHEEQRARAGWEKLRDAFDVATRDESFDSIARGGFGGDGY
jgi:hypothetical protein